MNAVRPGDRTSWLLLRGLGREKRHWRSFPGRLSDALGGARVLCLDLPGFGTEHTRRSPPTIPGIVDDVLRRFMTTRGGDRWSVLGISLGGMVALDWCASHPDDFAACVTINTSGRPSSTLERFRPGALRAVVGALTGGARAKELAVLRSSSNSARSKLDAVAEEQARWGVECPSSPWNLARQLEAAMRFEIPVAVTVPVLVLTSTADRLVSSRCSERIATALGAELRTDHRGGHDLALDEPDWICAQIAGWLGQSKPPNAK